MCAGLVDGLLQRSLGGINGTLFLLVHVEQHEVGVGILEESAHELVYNLEGESRCELLHHLIVVVKAGYGLLCQEVLHILADELAVESFFFVRVLLVELAVEV